MTAAMILAAGRGERLRPLTDATPKPLVEAGGKPLLVHHIEALANAGIRDIVINHAWLGEQIEATVGDGSQWGVSVQYSPEPGGALETGGGLLQALPLLNSDPFIVINADIWIDPGFLPLAPPRDASALAHLLLVDTPAFKARGDFVLNGQGRVALPPESDDSVTPALTFAGVSCLRKALFADSLLERCHTEPVTGGSGLPARRFGLADLLRIAIADQRVSGQHFSGDWFDIGTIDRLEALRARLGELGN